MPILELPCVSEDPSWSVDSPTLDIVVVNWNAGVHLPTCLDSTSRERRRDSTLSSCNRGQRVG